MGTDLSDESAPMLATIQQLLLWLIVAERQPKVRY